MGGNFGTGGVVLLTIDPGRSSGYAVWQGTTLAYCGVSCPAAMLERVTLAVVERPMIYPHGRTRDPNSIVTLAVDAGEQAGALRVCGVDVRYVLPREWKGTIDAEACCRRVWSRLDEAERGVAQAFAPRARLGKEHNVLDAIGIGLHVVGRLGR